MDELSTLGPNQVCKLTHGALSDEVLDPAALGFKAPKLDELVGGNATENAVIVEGVLAGTLKGPKRDIAVLNAAAGFVITGLAADVEAGKVLAERLLDRGAAHAKLRTLQDWC